MMGMGELAGGPVINASQQISMHNKKSMQEREREREREREKAYLQTSVPALRNFSKAGKIVALDRFSTGTANIRRSSVLISTPPTTQTP